MPKLHLVGITPDHKGLVLSEYARAKRGDLTLDIDESLIAAIEEARRLRARDDGKNLRSAALPTRREESPANGKAGSSLSPKEIQARLRVGHSITAVAREAGVGEAWIERFAPPVLAEQGLMVDKAKDLTLVKRGVGASAEPLGRAVPANVVERGASPSLADLDSAWRAYQRDDGTWCITFSFVQRGRRQTAEWVLDGGEVTARNRLAAELGHRDKRASRAAPAPAPAKAMKKRPLRAKPSRAATPRPAAKPKVETPKAKAPRAATPKVAAPPKAKAPEAATPEGATPEAATPEAATPEVAPKVETPEVEAPRVETPEAESRAPVPPPASVPPMAAVPSTAEPTVPLPDAPPELGTGAPEPPRVAALATPPAAPITARAPQARKTTKPPAKARTPRSAPAKERPTRETPVKAFLGKDEPAPVPPEVSSPAQPEPEPEVVAESQAELDLTAESTGPEAKTERAPKGQDRASAEPATRTP